MSPTTTVGYIGLGHAGYVMASNLAKAGFPLIIRDADRSREQKFAAEFPGARAAGPEGDAFRDCDVVITMLPNGKVVREVLLGTDGIAKSLRAGTVVVDISSSSPYDTRQLGSELHALSLALVDSPITQEYLHAIDTAGATLMIGSDSSDALDTVMPVLKAMSKYQFVMGKLGAGHAMKTLNNYSSVGSIIALCDSLVAGQKFGLDPATMIDVMNVGTGKNFSTAFSMKDDGLTRRYQSGYQLELLIKDVKITKEVMEGVGFETELPDLALTYLQHAMNQVEPGADHSECLKGWEQRAGVVLRGPPGQGPG